jgi:hypothetical protein
MVMKTEFSKFILENLTTKYYKFSFIWLVVKTMVEQKTCGEPVEIICKGCSQEQSCRSVYQKLTSFRGPSIVFKFILAFLLPLIIFIASLATFEQILAEIISKKQLRIICSFLAAFSITFVVLLIVKVINRKW